MPFGLSNAGSVHSRMLDRAMAGAFYRSVGTPGALEEGSTSSFSSRDQDTAKEDQDFLIRSIRVFRT